jgi:hypothetical protein
MICLNERCSRNEGNECSAPEMVKIGMIGECSVFMADLLALAAAETESERGTA